LELHFEDEREYPAGVVKLKFSCMPKCVLALSGTTAQAKESGPARQSQTLFGTYSSDKTVLSESDGPENHKTHVERIKPRSNLTNKGNTRSSLVSRQGPATVELCMVEGSERLKAQVVSN
jgi:hypothetical protein